MNIRKSVNMVNGGSTGAGSQNGFSQQRSSLLILFALIRRELFSLCISPAPYVSGLFFVLFCFYRFFFYYRFFIPGTGSTDLYRFFSSMPAASVLCIPALTMNLRNSSEDCFSLFPIGSFGRCFAKWFAAFCVFSFFVLVSAAIPLGASFFGSMDIPVLCTGIFGILSAAAALIAFGVWAACIFRSASLSFFISGLVFALSAFIHRIPRLFNLPAWLNELCRFTSFSWHFESALRGIIDSRDIIFYLCLTFLFLSLTAFDTEKAKYSVSCTSRQKKDTFILYKGIFLLCGMLLWNGTIFYLRFDISKNRMHSLSSETELITEKLQNRLTVSYYVSAELERMSAQVRQIQDFLYAYTELSSDISIRIIRIKNEEQKKTAENAGILPEYVHTDETASGAPVTIYSGIVLEYEEKTARIPFVLESAGLEFAVADKIAVLTGKEKRSVSLVIANGLKLEDDYPYLLSWLESAGFNVNVLQAAPFLRLSPSFTPVLLVGSSELNEEDSEACERFLQSGGRIFAAVSTNEVNTQSDWKVHPLRDHPFLFMLEKQGIRMETALLADVLCARIGLAEENAPNRNYIDYPFFVRIEKQNISNHPVVQALGGFDLFWPAPLELEQNTDTELVPLAHTSESAWIQYPLKEGAVPYDTDPFSRTAFAKDVKTQKQYPVAVAAQTAHGGKMIVVPDQYFVSHAVEYTGNFYNFDFLVNGLLWLSDEKALLSIKNRSFIDYAIKAEPDEELFRQKKYAVLTGVLLCVVFAFFSVFAAVHWYRKKLQKEGLSLCITGGEYE